MADPDKRIAALERALARQKMATRELEQLVEDRTRELYIAMERVKRQARLVGARTALALLAQHGTLERAAPAMLQAFGEELEWQIGAMWTIDPVRQVLRCIARWSATSMHAPDFQSLFDVVTFERGIGLPGRVWSSGTPAWILDVTADPNFPRGPVAARESIRSGCAFPILVDGQTFAVVEMFARETREHDEDLVVTFAALGSQIGQFIEHMRAQEQARNKEVEIARRIQTSILPRVLGVAGLEIATSMVPADQVGGDYYDVLPFDGGAWLGIGDVSGHGVGTGMIMIMVQSAVAALALHATSPREIVVALNTLLHENIRLRIGGDDHVTFSLLRYTADGRIRYSGAHEDILVWRAATGVCEQIETDGTWLGIRPTVEAATINQELQLERGDVLLLYTDGLIEARDRHKQQFGVDRLKHELTKLAAAHLAISDICEALVRHALQWGERQEDDISLIVARYVGS